MEEGKSKTILIVDDEIFICKLIQKLIHWDELNFTCLDTVYNGADALKIIYEKRPNVVITDIRMPEINGLDLISRIREFDKNILFIVISGYKEFEYAQKALQYGVVNYLLKPINEVELNSILKKIRENLAHLDNQAEKIRQMDKTITASENIMKSSLLNNIIEDKEPASAVEIKKNYNINPELFMKV